MEVVGAAANVIAVVDLAAKIAVLCSQYFAAVSNARAEITRLQKQTKSLRRTLQRADRLLKTPNRQPLPASRDLKKILKECRNDLERLRTKLEPGTARKAMQRVGIRSFKWPFNKEEVAEIITSLKTYQDEIILNLQIDQTDLLVDIKTRIEDLSMQPVVETPITCKPHFVIPFPRDPDFVERPMLQTWIKQQYEGPASRIALVGLGGFGKSQIAIEFAYQIHLSSPDISVFWVHGGTKAKFEESYRSLADTLMLPSRHDPNINILKLIHDWLQKDDIASWLMVLDNADNSNVFFSGQPGSGQEPIASFLPRTNKGKILITSRNLDTAERLTGRHKSIQRIHTMHSSEALQILRKKLTKEVAFEKEIAETLVRTLDFVPLAVNQAAAYINRRAPRVSMKSYLDDFHRSEKHKASLLNKDAGDLRRLEGVSNSVVVTWQLTFEQIRQERPAASHLLSLMSLFHAQGIPEFMLSGYSAANARCERSNSNIDEDFEEDLDILRAYSLVNIPRKRGLLNMHPLVQFCLRTWLLQSGKLKRFQDLFLRLSAIHFPSGCFETWATCQILMPHMKSLLERDIESMDEANILDWSELLTKVSWYLFNIGDYFTAENNARNTVEAKRKVLGNESLSLLRSMHDLAVICIYQGQWAEAEGLLVKVIAITKKVKGDEQHETLNSMSNLAITYRRQERWPEAEELQKQVMEIRKRALGDEHPTTLFSMGNLAIIYHGQGREAEAEKLEVYVMETFKRVLGDQHPDTLLSMNNLALTLWKLGRPQEALAMIRGCVSSRQRVLGPEHPDTISSTETLKQWERGHV